MPYDLADLLFRLGYDILLLIGDSHIVDRDRDSRLGRIFVAHLLDRVKDLGGLSRVIVLRALIDYLAEFLLRNDEGDLKGKLVAGLRAIDESEVLRQRLIVDKSSEGDRLRSGYDALFAVLTDLDTDKFGSFDTADLLRVSHGDRSMKPYLMLLVSHDRLVEVAEYATGAGLFGLHYRKIVRAEDHILCRNGNGVTVDRLQKVVCREH